MKFNSELTFNLEEFEDCTADLLQNCRQISLQHCMYGWEPTEGAKVLNERCVIYNFLKGMAEERRKNIEDYYDVYSMCMLVVLFCFLSIEPAKRKRGERAVEKATPDYGSLSYIIIIIIVDSTTYTRARTRVWKHNKLTILLYCTTSC